MKKKALEKAIQREFAEIKNSTLPEDYLLGKEYVLNKFCAEFGLKLKKDCSVKPSDAQAPIQQKRGMRSLREF